MEQRADVNAGRDLLSRPQGCVLWRMPVALHKTLATGLQTPSRFEAEASLFDELSRIHRFDAEAA